MERNEGVVEWRAAKDTGAAVRNAKELQAVWQTAKWNGAPETWWGTKHAKGIAAIKMPVRNNHWIHFFCCNGLADCLPTTNDEHLFTGYGESWWSEKELFYEEELSGSCEWWWTEALLTEWNGVSKHYMNVPKAHFFPLTKLNVYVYWKMGTIQYVFEMYNWNEEEKWQWLNL